MRHTHRSPSCDYVIETRGRDFISAILSQVKSGIINSYSRSNSSSNIAGAEAEFSKMKLRVTKTAGKAGSGWQLDPYKERGVGGAGPVTKERTGSGKAGKRKSKAK